MTKREALRKSILLKWVVKVKNLLEKEQLAAAECFLCEMFNKDPVAHKDCTPCVVKKYTGWNQCCRTPYWDYCSRKTKKGKLTACWNEVDFLINIWYAEGYKTNKWGLPV